MKEESVATPVNLLAVSQNMLESYDSTIALRSNGNQALGKSSQKLFKIIWNQIVNKSEPT